MRIFQLGFCMAQRAYSWTLKKGYARNVYALTNHDTLTFLTRVLTFSYGISALVTQTSFCEGSSGDLAKRRLFSQATSRYISDRNTPSTHEQQQKRRHQKQQEEASFGRP